MNKNKNKLCMFYIYTHVYRHIKTGKKFSEL